MKNKGINSMFMSDKKEAIEYENKIILLLYLF